MDLVTLYAGLLLPWLCGVTWLVFAERRLQSSITPNLFRQIGYGFFLGYAGLFVAIMTSFTLSGEVSWSGLMVFLFLATMIGAVLNWRMPASRSAISSPTESTPLACPLSEPFVFNNASPAIKLLLAVLLLWTGIHLLIYAIDVYTQPVYPWDAWLAWIYRAKAWFLGGGIAPVVSAVDWASSSNPTTYTIDAWMYPIFASIIPYWAALSLGQWNETLINVPVIFAGLAIGMAIYGQCREFGLGFVSSVLCIYLLYSIPLLGIHIGLAGYADIWMAGYTGLGFVALIRALALRAAPVSSGFRAQITLAFTLLVFAIFVKNEGAVWLLTAVSLLVFLSYRARVPVLLSVCAALLLLMGFAFGTTHINIPGIGTLGFENGRLMIPFIGNFALELHSIWYSYLTNFFSLGSWNLFWVMVLTALIIAIRPIPDDFSQAVQRIGLTFVLLFLATQFFIFGLTDQGIWADAFTAINRLPLHFVPALLFTSFAIFHVQWWQKAYADD